jgi:hypothetical protein
MKQRTNGRAVQGAARESNGARKGLRVGMLQAACTLQTESERYEYDKARRHFIQDSHRERRRVWCHERSGRGDARTPPPVGGGSILHLY